MAAVILVLFALGGAAFLELMGISLAGVSDFRRPAAVSDGARDGVRARIRHPHLEQRGGREPAARGHLGVSAGVSRSSPAPARWPPSCCGSDRCTSAAEPRCSLRYLARRVRGARHRAGADVARATRCMRVIGVTGRQCREPAAGRDPGGAGGAVRARRPAPGLRRRLIFSLARRKARSHTSWPRRSPRRSKRVGSRSVGRGTKPPSAARFSSIAFGAERFEHLRA